MGKLVYNAEKAADRIHIKFSVVHMGSDLCVAICGGNRPHIGAVAAAQVRASLADSRNTSATVSILTFTGHKEDEIASRVAKRLAIQLQQNTVVCCGIHVDSITADEIRTVNEMVDEMVEEYEQKGRA